MLAQVPGCYPGLSHETPSALRNRLLTRSLSLPVLTSSPRASFNTNYFFGHIIIRNADCDCWERGLSSAQDGLRLIHPLTRMVLTSSARGGV
jgi:hypothetical protein